MVPALILVLAVWCPIPTTTTAPPSTTSTSVSTTSTTAPALIILPPDPFPSTTTTATPTTTTTVAPVVVDAARITRPVPVRQLPVTGPDGRGLVLAGFLVMLGGLLVAACRSS